MSPDNLPTYLHYLKPKTPSQTEIIFALQVRNDCLTCITFEAYRMYIVGKTQPVPVKVYDYYEPGKFSSFLSLREP